MTECFNTACPYCVDYQCRRTCTCDMRLDGEYIKVVRCKDCKLFDPEHEGGIGSCGIDMNVTANDYCSKAERKDEVEE